ncbi:MAG: thioredoxin domain-containing protein, partial [Bryobacteraceae bacterium]
MAMIRKFVAAALSVAALAMAVPVAHAEMTQEQVQEMLTELKGIRSALEKMTAPAPAAQPQEPVSDKVSMAMPANAYEIGKSDAPLVMIEYTDLQCPFCQQFHNTAFDQIKKNYIDT